MKQSKPTWITVIRHGETEWNRAGKQQGHLDSPLTENGIAQARTLARGLSGTGIEICISSDLGRALHTAKIIAENLAVSIKTDSRLRERNLGVMQGKTIEEFKKSDPREWERFLLNGPDYRLAGGESKRDRFERNWSFFTEAAETYGGRHLLISAHGGVLDSLIRGVLNIPLESLRRFSLINGSINRFRYEDGVWHLLSWGETNHMKGLEFLDDF